MQKSRIRLFFLLALFYFLKSDILGKLGRDMGTSECILVLKGLWLPRPGLS